MIMTVAGKSSPFMRISLTFAYACIGTSGLLLVLSPVFATVNTPLALTMVWFLLVGGYLGMLGAASNRWAGEFTGLPLLIAAFSVFGFITKHENAGTPYIAWANLFLLNGLALVILARWAYVYAVANAAERFSRKKAPR